MYLIEFRSGSYFQDLDTWNGGPKETAKRFVSEMAALREENARLRAALQEAEQTRDGALYRARLLSERMLREKR